MNTYREDSSTILSVLKSHPRGMSVTDIAQETGTNRNTVSRYLDMLRISGQVEMKTYGKAKVFFLSQRVPISAMLDFSSDMVIILDRDMRIIQVNDATCIFTGMTGDDITGRELHKSPLAAFDHPLIRSKIKKGIDGEEYTDELSFRKVDEELFFRFKVIPTVFNDGLPGVTLILEDITEKKRSEEALRERENRYRSLVEEINDILWNIDENADFAYISPRVSDILGYRPEELLGKSVYSLLDPSDADSVRSLLSSSPPRPFFLIEYPVRNKSGNTIILESSGRPIFDEIGEYSGYRIVSRDVSDRNVAIKQLTQWKSFLFSIVENIPARILVKDIKSDTYVFLNRSAEAFFGKSREELTGKSDEILFPKSILPLLLAADEKVIKTENPIEEPEVSIPLHGVQPRILRIRKLPIFSSKQELKFILTIGEDITAVKEKENQLVQERDLARSYLDMAGVMIVVIDREGRIIQINRKGCELLDYHEDELVGQDWFSVIVPDRFSIELRRQFAALMSGKGAPPEKETGFVKTKNGDEHTIHWNNSLVLDSSGTIVAMVSSGERFSGQ